MSWHCSGCGLPHATQYDEPTRCDACETEAQYLEVVAEIEAERDELLRMAESRAHEAERAADVAIEMKETAQRERDEARAEVGCLRTKLIKVTRERDELQRDRYIAAANEAQVHEAQQILTDVDRLRFGSVIQVIGERDEARAEVERLRTQTRWIPVEERLPEDGQLCAILWEDGRVFNGRYEPPNEVRTIAIWGSDTTGYSASRVTHWVPLPEPPEGER